MFSLDFSHVEIFLIFVGISVLIYGLYSREVYNLARYSIPTYNTGTVIQASERLVDVPTCSIAVKRALTRAYLSIISVPYSALHCIVPGAKIFFSLFYKNCLIFVIIPF